MDVLLIEMIKKFTRDGPVIFPALKSLFTGDIVIGTTNYINLIIMCPVLEELFIRNDEGDNPPSWIRRLQSYCLKRLVIYFHVPKYRKVYEDEVAVMAPNLTYFEYSGYVSSFYMLSRMRSLVEAKLDLRLWELTIRYDDDYEDGHRSVNGFNVIFGNTTFLLDVISRNVKTLHLSPHSLEAILFCCEYIPFSKTSLLYHSKVTRIKAGICGDVCPCLFRTKKRNKVKESVSKKSCLPTLAVKVLEISGYGGTRREIQQMRHFLVNLKCLEVVKIGVVQQENRWWLYNESQVLYLFETCAEFVYSYEGYVQMKGDPLTNECFFEANNEVEAKHESEEVVKPPPICPIESSTTEVGDTLVLKAFDDPFLLVFHKGDILQEIKTHIQQELHLGNQEFTKVYTYTRGWPALQA
ncbi:unnamed protein product, partial [Brassica oleracea]